MKLDLSIGDGEDGLELAGIAEKAGLAKFA